MSVSHVHERLTEHAHDRVAERRTDPDWLETHWADDATRVLVVAGNRVLPAPDGLAWVCPAKAPAGTRMLLGEHDGTAYFAVVVAAAAASDDWVPLRTALSTLAARGGTSATAEASLVLHAVGLAEWLGSTHYCSRCGEPVRPQKEGHELVCGNGHRTFPRTDPAVIMLITTGEPGDDEERCLLGHQARWPEGRYSTLAGFCEPGESLEDAVRREVHEETGVRVGEVSYFGNQPWPMPASLMVGFTGRAESTAIACDGEEIADARWLTRAELRTEAEAGRLILPGNISISRSLIESWYGGPLPSSW